MINKYLLIALTCGAILLTSCTDEGEDVNPTIEVPESYVFERNGISSVDYSGQTARLDMLAELKAYIATANDSLSLNEQTLLNMFANENSPFADATLNESGKELEDKTFLTDVNYYKEVLSSAAAASETVIEATEGTAGLIARSATRMILVNEKGHEYTQIVEKGLMGATFLNQIYNAYLTDAKTGADVDNVTIVEGKNYTTLEHHFDEAFGYWGVNVDFDAEGENRFLGNYTLGREGFTSAAEALKEAFLKGRTAIVNNDFVTLEAQKAIIYEQFETAVAATVIHYINESITDLNNAEIGSLFHHASEGYGFALGLKYSPVKKITDSQYNDLVNVGFGTNGNFWSMSVESLNSAKSILISAYPALADIADDL